MMRKIMAIVLAVLTMTGVGAVGVSAADAEISQEDVTVSIEVVAEAADGEVSAAAWEWLEDILSWDGAKETDTHYTLIVIARWILRGVIVAPLARITKGGRWLWGKFF